MRCAIAYVLYIGAGAVLAGGIISLIRVIPALAAAFVRGIASLPSPRDKPTRRAGPSGFADRIRRDRRGGIGGCAQADSGGLTCRS